MNSQDDRRGNARIPISAHAVLSTAARSYPAHLLNLSQDGALVAITEQAPTIQGEDITLQIDSDLGTFELAGRIVRQHEDYIGLECNPIDEESEEALAALLRDSAGLMAGLDDF